MSMQPADSDNPDDPVDIGYWVFGYVYDLTLVSYC